MVSQMCAVLLLVLLRVAHIRSDNLCKKAIQGSTGDFEEAAA